MKAALSKFFSLIAKYQTAIGATAALISLGLAKIYLKFMSLVVSVPLWLLLILIILPFWIYNLAKVFGAKKLFHKKQFVTLGGEGPKYLVKGYVPLTRYVLCHVKKGETVIYHQDLLEIYQPRPLPPPRRSAWL